MATGNLTLRPDSIVTEVLFDPETQRATGVRILDTETMEYKEYYAKIVFLCASAIASAYILMNSTEHFSDGMGNASGELGRNIMDHHLNIGAYGTFEGFEDMYYYGRRPNGIYIPDLEIFTATIWILYVVMDTKAVQVERAGKKVLQN